MAYHKPSMHRKTYVHEVSQSRVVEKRHFSRIRTEVVQLLILSVSSSRVLYSLPTVVDTP